MNKDALFHQLELLTEEGYIEPEQLSRIKEEYGQKDMGKSRTFLMLALLGVLFIGAGVISVFAFNWSMFPRSGKAILALLLLFSVQVLFYRMIQKKEDKAWTESLSLALGLAFLSALGLIYQAYQLSFSLESMLLLCYLLTLPIVYMMDAYALALLCFGGVCWLGFSGYSILFGIFLFPFMMLRIRKGEGCRLLAFCFFLWFLKLPYILLPDMQYETQLFLLLLLTIAPSLGGVATLARWSLYGMMFAKTLETSQYFGLWDRAIEPFGLIWAVPALLLFCWLCRWIWQMKKRRDLSASTHEFLLLLMVLILVAGSRGLPGTYMLEWSIVNLFVLGYTIYRIFCGIRTRRLASSRRYAVMLTIYLLHWIFVGSFNLLIKGVCFIIIGGGFLWANYLLARMIKIPAPKAVKEPEKEEAHEEI